MDTTQKRPGTVYLIHFDKPFKHAKHYLGWAKDLQARLDHHAAGSGANLMRVIKEAGITWRLARTWEGTKGRERQLKNQGGRSRMCPVCKEEKTLDKPAKTLGELVEKYKAGEVSREQVKAAIVQLDVIHDQAVICQPEIGNEIDREMEIS